LVVLALLAGVALWGHFNEWTMPKFSTLLGETAEAESSWCPTHNVPEAECIECNPLLLDEQPNYGWCAEHGIVQCVLEHPDVAQLKETPVIDSEDLERARRALALRSRSENNSRCPAYQRRIQFASLEAIEKAGVDITVVVRRPTVEAIVANGELIYDQTHSAHLASRVPGNVWRVERQVGDAVKNGDVLALIDAAEIGRAKSEFLQSIAQLRLRVANYKRLSSLAGDGTVAVRAVREEEASMQEAEIRLLGAQQTLVNLGLPVDAAEFEDLRTDEISRRIQFLGVQYDLAEVLDPAQTTSNLFPLRSPLDGVVVSRHIVPGEVVDTSTTLFEVTDLRKLWLMLDVRQEDARFVALGQPVFFRPSDSRDAVDIEGRVSWISTSADDQTRTVNVRVDLPNADGKLRANTFGTGRIVLRDEPNAIVVPSEAVQSDGDCTFVFVRDKNFLREGSPKFFHVRQVRTGVSAGGNTEIIAGVLPGEVLAGKNSALLTAQLLKSNLGAGCGCVEGAH
jgi:multidrug efflux pump subunit AcrA (membrane-fusion protein)